MREPWEELAHIEAMENKRRARLPKCALCGEPMDQEYGVRYSGQWLCDICLDDMREPIEEVEAWND